MQHEQITIKRHSFLYLAVRFILAWIKGVDQVKLTQGYQITL